MLWRPVGKKRASSNADVARQGEADHVCVHGADEAMCGEVEAVAVAACQVEVEVGAEGGGSERACALR